MGICVLVNEDRHAGVKETCWGVGSRVRVKARAGQWLGLATVRLGSLLGLAVGPNLGPGEGRQASSYWACVANLVASPK